MQSANSSNWIGLVFGVVLASFGQRQFVVPDVLGRAGAVEEQQVRGDGRVGGEDTVGEPHNGVQVEFLEEFFLDPGADAIAEERAVGNDDRGSSGTVAPCSRLLEPAHDELQEQQGRFAGLLVGWEVVANAGFLFAAKRGIGEDHVYLIAGRQAR